MKKKIANILLMLIGTSAFGKEIAERNIESVVLTQSQPSEVLCVTRPPRNAFTYLRMGACPAQGVGAMPGMGIGYRIISGFSAADFSVNFSGRNQRHYSYATSYSLPKANYLYYFNPTEDNSLYVGGGLAWGGIHKEIRDYQNEDSSTEFDFDGIIANVAIGYEIHRTSTIRSFVQLDLNQPTLAVSQRHDFPSPTAELGVGIGF